MQVEVVKRIQLPKIHLSLEAWHIVFESWPVIVSDRYGELGGSKFRSMVLSIHKLKKNLNHKAAATTKNKTL